MINERRLKPGKSSSVYNLLKIVVVSSLLFLFVFNCKNESNGGSKDKDNPTPVIFEYTLSITKSIYGTLSSDAGGINCGSKGITCKAKFDKGTEVTLVATADPDYGLEDWEGACQDFLPSEDCTLSMDVNKSAGKVFIDTDVDDDNDGLIEIHNLDMFNNIRHNLAGTSYKTSGSATDNRMGAPEEATDDCKVPTDGAYLCGYELTKDLDFAQGASYANGVVNQDWRPNSTKPNDATNAGFDGINHFFAIFEGNEYTISNLYSRASTKDVDEAVGLFKSVNKNALIRNLGVLDAEIYGRIKEDNNGVGALLGQSKSATLGILIKACYATGNVYGGDGDDNVGGLVGFSDRGSEITASYADVNVYGGDRNDAVGGLVGFSDSSSEITASYATGNVYGGDGDDAVGGLVGFHRGRRITANYATGNVYGGDRNDAVGGLVGVVAHGDLIANYATGDANGDAGNDSAGGLVGDNQGHAIASYATGNVYGGDGDDNVGSFVGRLFRRTAAVTGSYATGDVDGGNGDDHAGTLAGRLNTRRPLDTFSNFVFSSYAFGSKSGGETAGYDGTTYPVGVTDANGLTVDNAGSEWNDAGENTLGAWDFGTTSQPPVLKYADYDDAGASSVDYCAMFPAKIPGIDTDLSCGDSLLPGQER